MKLQTISKVQHQVISFAKIYLNMPKIKYQIEKNF